MPRIALLFWLDTFLFVAVALLQTPRTTSLVGHEWIGLAFAIAIALHLVVNWRWIVTTLRRLAGADSRRARINALLNGTLFVVMVVTVVSGFTISEVILPLTGLEPSILRAWRQLHSLMATLGVVIVGLHVALNWDWIAGVVRKRLFMRRSTEAVTVGAPDVEFGGIRTAVRRFSALGLVVVTLSAACFALVESTGSEPIRRGGTGPATGSPATSQASRRQRDWATGELANLPLEAVKVFLGVGVVAVVGRKLLRLRL